jgi:cytochrome c-type biogenesis protein CcmH/NrfG
MHLQSLGEHPAASARFREAISAYRRGLDRLPDNAEISNYLAEGLVKCPDLQIRDPKAGVELARAAVRRVPTAGNYWRTLGVAAYAAGNPGEAAAALERASSLLSSPKPTRRPPSPSPWPTPGWAITTGPAPGSVRPSGGSPPAA